MYVVLTLITSILAIGGALFFRLWEIRRAADQNEDGKGVVKSGMRAVSQ